MTFVLTPTDILAISWFVFCWSGYTLFASQRAKRVPAISTSLARVRKLWIERVLTRDMRISDATALGILQRNVAFFASTTIFILAGLLTVLGSADKAIQLTNTLPFSIENSPELFELKVLLLVWIFVYAFFKFSWSVRQYNFTVVLFGAAPVIDGNEQEKKQFVSSASDLLSSSNNSFNLGLRAYHFSMAVLAWFVQPWLFILATTWVVAIIYRREFRSRSLNAIQMMLGYPF